MFDPVHDSQALSKLARFLAGWLKVIISKVRDLKNDRTSVEVRVWPVLPGNRQKGTPATHSVRTGKGDR